MARYKAKIDGSFEKFNNDTGVWDAVSATNRAIEVSTGAVQIQKHVTDGTLKYTHVTTPTANTKFEYSISNTVIDHSLITDYPCWVTIAGERSIDIEFSASEI